VVQTIGWRIEAHQAAGRCTSTKLPQPLPRVGSLTAGYQTEDRNADHPIGMFPGRTLDQKRDLVKGVTQAVCDALGVDPDTVRITIVDNEVHNVARGGILRSD
jgi:4-oxalocrotonate tautomerase